MPIRYLAVAALLIWYLAVAALLIQYLAVAARVLLAGQEYIVAVDLHLAGPLRVPGGQGREVSVGVVRWW